MSNRNPHEACTEEMFLKDIATHQVSVLRDDGLYRHLMCRRPNTNCYWFEILTWPGRLCISGDMGDFVFSRLPDMFEFFRDNDNKGRVRRINPGYWAEKLQAHDRNGGHEEFSPGRFKENVLHTVEQYFEDGDQSQKAIVLSEVAHLVLPHASDGEHEAHRAAIEYEHTESRFHMSDFYERNCREYTLHFLWCLYAIVWAIEKYDAATNSAPR